MTSILKNQIIKHLSKFVKNLSPDKINLSTLRGEGELSNLELDEKVLTSLLELPNWLTLDRAWCNRVSIRIPWTKLKTHPICLSLDEVHVSMGTCSELRQPTTSASTNNLKPPVYSAGKYGFADKVVDGVTVQVNSLIISFKSPAFEASLQFSRILLESSSPTWTASDLRFSRLKNNDQGLILLFKELQWQTLRLEARSTTCDVSLPPLRLITNQSRCRITIKKRLLDCAVIGCRLVLIMDELLWVLTDAQLSAAILFLQSLSHLIEKDTLVNQRFKAARKLETLPEYLAQQQQQQQRGGGTAGASALNRPTDALSRVFARYDVLETSYHFFSEKIDFHFCDDPGEGRSSHPELKEGGALQLTLSQLQLDFYPYHWAAAEAGTNRQHWLRYEEGPLSRWVQQAVDQFAKQLLHMDSPAHSKLTRTGGQDGGPQHSPRPSPPGPGSSQLHDSILIHLRQLMSSCLILRLGDLLIYRVSTSKLRQSPKEFIVGDRGRFPLPDSVPIVHLELTQFYYPGDLEFPLPQPKCFVQLNPIQVNFDGLTLLWLHSFTRGLEKTLTSLTSPEAKAKSNPAEEPRLEIRLEALMPRMIMEVPGWDRPRSLQLQVSRLVCSNYRSNDSGSRADLAACLEKIQGHGTSGGGSGLCFASTFPAREKDLSPISEELLKHTLHPPPPSQMAGWKRDLLWSKESSEVWFIHCDPFWADFFITGGGSSVTKVGKPTPFIGTVPITAWIHADPERICGLLQVNSLVSVQLSRAEYVFLLRFMENMTEMTAFLSHQEKHFSNGTVSSQAVVIGAVIPQLDVSITFPPQAALALQQITDGESLIGDTESICPDSSSMTDLAQFSRTNGRGIKQMSISHSEYNMNSQPGESFDDSGVSQIDTISKSQSDTTISLPPSVIGREETVEETKPNGRFVTFAQDRPPPPLIQSGFGTSMKRWGIHGFMSTVDAAFGNKHNIIDDMSDTYSIRSDGSSDSENFVVLHGEQLQMGDGAAVFRTKSGTPFVKCEPQSATLLRAADDALSEVEVAEVALEVREDTPTNSDHSSAPLTTTSQPSTAVRRMRDLAVVTFHINDLELIQQSVADTSSIRMQAGHVSCDECVAIPREEFQSKFASRSRGWREVPIGNDPVTGNSSSPSVCPLRLRMEQKMDFDPERIDLSGSLREAVAASIDAWIEASLTHLNLSLLLSSVTGLTAFIEDELIAPVVPLFLSLRDVECSLTEDRPSVFVGGPPPALAPPMVVRIKHLLVQRNHSGVISVGVAEPSPPTSNQPGGRSTSGSSRDSPQEALTVLRARIEELERENQSLRQLIGNSSAATN